MLLLSPPYMTTCFENVLVALPKQAASGQTFGVHIRVQNGWGRSI